MNDFNGSQCQATSLNGSTSKLTHYHTTAKVKSCQNVSGMSEYHAWAHARNRCINPRAQSYKHYGGRGITMCPEWLDSFQAFYEHIGPRPAGLVLDRIDNDRGYEPGNVRWTTWEVSGSNRRARGFYRVVERPRKPQQPFSEGLRAFVGALDSLEALRPAAQRHPSSLAA